MRKNEVTATMRKSIITCLIATTIGSTTINVLAETESADSIKVDEWHWQSGDEPSGHELDRVKIGTGPLTVAVRFVVPGPDWTGTLLSRRAKPGEPSLTVTAFRHEPFGKRFIGFAMDGVAEGPTQVAAKTVRDDVVGGHLIAAFAPMGTELDEGEHLLVARVGGETTELFLDGTLCERRSSKRFTTRTYLKLYPHAAVGWRVGADPNGRDAFAGRVEQVSLWLRTLGDDELRPLCGGTLQTTTPPAPPVKVIASALFPVEMPDEQRMKEVDAAMPRWLAEMLRRDKWFPRYHPALPVGMMFDTRCAIHHGRYHLFPTWRSDLHLNSGVPGSFRMQHLSSTDLIHWRLESFPIRLADRDVCNGGPVMLNDEPHFFFLRYGPNGAPHRAVPVDDSLTRWVLPERQPVITVDGDGYYGRLDATVFQHEGRYYLTGTRRNTDKASMAMPLYRSDDLANWEFAGDFYQTDTGKLFNECPQIFRVGGKMVVTAFYPLRGRHDNMLVGHFDGERFHADSSQRFDYGGHGHQRSLDADVVPDGRVIGWSTISVYAEDDALDVARAGWKGMHSIPREVTLNRDGALEFRPAREVDLLRGASTEMTLADLAADGELRLPDGHEGSLEISVTLPEIGASSAELRLVWADGAITVSIDAETRGLVLDLKNAPRHGGDTGHIYRSPPLTAGNGEPINLRVFFDRSVVEAYAAGVVMTCRVFPARPEELTATLKCRAGEWKTGSAQIHTMRSIWSEDKQS